MARRLHWQTAGEPEGATKRHRFLIGRVPSLDQLRPDAINRLRLLGGTLRALATDGAVIVFAPNDWTNIAEAGFVIPA